MGWQKPIIHKADEFATCPFDQLTAENQPNWSFGCGGYGFENTTFTVKIFSENGDKEEVWQVPSGIAYIIETYARWQVEDLQRNLKDLLGVSS